MPVIELKAPAKINLYLKILNRREDGYHNLSMLMEKISLCDEISLEKISSGVELVSPPLNIPPEENLAFKAAKALREVSNTSQVSDSRGVRVYLTKKIPMGGGLGGGSSDAAAVLKGLNKLWGLGYPPQRLAAIGAKLGADIPFFLYDGPAKVEGIGEKITPLKKFPKLWIILIYPGFPVDTAWAYSAWNDNGLTQKNHSVSLPADFGSLLKALHNDFEEVVTPKHPQIQQAREALQRAGAEGALMSGSGSIVFGLFETKDERDRALKKIAVKPQWQMFVAENRN